MICIMIKLTLIEFIFRCIPESFLVSFASSLFSYKKGDYKRISLSGIFIAVSIYLIRLLPVYFGVHAILNYMAVFIILVNIGGIYITRAAASALIYMILLFSCEVVNILVVKYVFSLNVKYILSGNAVNKVMYGTPSLILFALIILLLYIFRDRIISAKRRILYNEYLSDNKLINKNCNLNK